MPNIYQRSYSLGITLIVLPAAFLSAENYAGDFLDLGVGSRALGLGGAYVAVADDITATYWNPAGLAQLAKDGLTNKELRTQIAVQHATRRSGLGHFNYLAVGRKLKSPVALAFSWIHAGIDEIPVFPSFDPNITPGDRRYTEKYRPTFTPAGFISDSQNAYTFTLASSYRIPPEWWDLFGTTSFPPQLLMGLNLKRIAHLLADDKASGYGLDLGLLVHLPDLNAVIGATGFGGLSLGVYWQSQIAVSWKNRDIPISSSHQEVIPHQVRLGLAYLNQVWERQLLLLWTVIQSASISRNLPSRYRRQDRLGVEYQLSQRLALRIGCQNRRPTCGVGLQTTRSDALVLKIDYGLTSNDIVNTHFVSLIMLF